MTVRFAHTNLIAKDWRRLAAFYETVFGCTPIPPERDLSGQWLDRATGLEGARISGIHLRLPGYGDDGPTLELFQYGSASDRPETRPNTPGFSHIAFAVDDVVKTARAVFDAGGHPVGELTTREIPGAGVLTFQYVADPEGNIIEIQNWGRRTPEVHRQAAGNMETTITRCTKADFDEILSDLPRFWGESRADLLRPLHHPMYIYEFGDTCFVARHGEELVGYLFGFISQTEPTGYIHLTAVRIDSRKRGVGAELHSAFVGKARALGCKHIKAITSPGNSESIEFYQAMGMQLLGEAEAERERVPVVKDYSGPGADRVVFWKDI